MLNCINSKFSVFKTNLLNKDQFIANETIELIQDYLKNKEQVLFFLNRRGYAPFLICKKCGFKHLCSNCSIYLTYHKSINKLICHHCGDKVKKDNHCKVDKNLCDFRMFGPGVEKIYEELILGKNLVKTRIKNILSANEKMNISLDYSIIVSQLRSSYVKNDIKKVLHYLKLYA